MAEVPSSIAISPSGSTLLNAMQVTTSAGSVLNEVVTLGDYASGQVATVLAEGALLIEPGGTNTQPVSGTFFPPVQTVTGTVAVIQATATNISITAVQPTAASLNATVIGTVTANAGTGTLAVSAASLPLGLGAGTLGYGQVVVTSAATQIITTRANRKVLLIEIIANGPNLFLGDASVATNTGLLLLGIQGATVSLPTAAAVYGWASGTTTSNAVSYMEIYG
jgi:hypothetical protein